VAGVGFATRTITVSNGCNSNTPGWGATLGTVTWGSSANTNIESGITTIPGTGGRPMQLWSGAVQTVACRKGNATAGNAYAGGTAGNFNADCRQTLAQSNGTAANRDRQGHYFSWCAMRRFAEQLCPAPWRVPTSQDFVDLDRNLGRTGINGYGNPVGIYCSASGTNTAPEFGGTWGGDRWTGHATHLVSTGSDYWSSTEVSLTDASYLHYNTDYIYPENSNLKSHGFPIRCVRNLDIHIYGGDTNIRTAAGSNTTTWIGFPTGGTWQSSNPAVATVSSAGVVTGVAAGSAVITYTVEGVGVATRTIRVLPQGCNTNTPGWGATLGTITWGSSANTDIETGTSTVTGTGGRPTQEWSGAVQAVACRKGNATANNAFAGGTVGNFNADCRQTLAQSNGTAANRDQQGHLFSWCAVMRFADELCPPTGGWRVPDSADFGILHRNLGYAMPIHSGGTVSLIGNTYIPGSGTAAIPEFGGTWGGARWTPSVGLLTEEASYYWSSTEGGAANVYYLFLYSGSLTPHGIFSRANGITLRCVRTP
jgi:uncharacterized protein (TIGR02145 family)